jgi:hypothetical protein
MSATIPSALAVPATELLDNDAARDKSNSDLIVVVAFCAAGLALAIGLAWLYPFPDDVGGAVSTLS